MSRLRDKVPVEPLTPDRVARVEHAVLAAYRATAVEPAGRHRAWRWLAVGMPVAAAAALAMLFFFGDSEPPQPMLRAAAPPAPTHVVSGDDGSTLDLGGATIHVGVDSELDIRREGGGIQVALARGSVECEVDPRGERPPFVVEAGKVHVIVVGTVFKVERDGDDVRVTVTRGEVRVESAGEHAAVAAGQVWVDGQVRVATAGAPGGEGDDAVADESVRIASSDTTGAAPASKSRKTPRKKHRASSRSRKRSSTGTRPEPAREAARAKGFAGVGAPSFAKGDASAVGSESRKGVYSQAWVAMLRERDARKALAKLKYFERRFTRGALSEDVLKMRIRIQCKKASSACRQAAHRYLNQYPAGDYRDQARALTNWM